MQRRLENEFNQLHETFGCHSTYLIPPTSTSRPPPQPFNLKLLPVSVTRAPPKSRKWKLEMHLITISVSLLLEERAVKNSDAEMLQVLKGRMSGNPFGLRPVGIRFNLSSRTHRLLPSAQIRRWMWSFGWSSVSAVRSPLLPLVRVVSVMWKSTQCEPDLVLWGPPRGRWTLGKAKPPLNTHQYWRSGIPEFHLSLCLLWAGFGLRKATTPFYNFTNLEKECSRSYLFLCRGFFFDPPVSSEQNKPMHWVSLIVIQAALKTLELHRYISPYLLVSAYCEYVAIADHVCPPEGTDALIFTL